MLNNCQILIDILTTKTVLKDTFHFETNIFFNRKWQLSKMEIKTLQLAINVKVECNYFLKPNAKIETFLGEPFFWT